LNLTVYASSFKAVIVYLQLLAHLAEGRESLYHGAASVVCLSSIICPSGVKLSCKWLHLKNQKANFN